ncbi:MAG TPA: ATP-binding cassette domain-containing protein [Gemmatimonadota bacterium]|nr:ATP-binding cassette domain-containing protein [Gemmatimonadota bacterium]
MSADSAAPAVEFDQVAFSLPDGRVLFAGLTLAVGTDETVVLVGRSGVGKTTLLKLVNRLLDPAAGVVRVAGRPTTDWDPVALRRRTGYVIQEVGLFPHLTVAGNVGLVPDLLGWERIRIDERTAELLELVGLPAGEFGRRYPHELSGGQRQRVGVARALAADPPLLLLDEPFGALDPLTRADLQQEFRQLVQRLEKAALFVTHDLREALALGGRVGLLTEDGLAEIAPPAEFLASSHPEVRGLVEALGGGPGG